MNTLKILVVAVNLWG